MDIEFVDIYDFPILYNEEKGRKWKIWVDGNNIYRTDGLISKDFTKKPSCRIITAKRHTTEDEQALLEAERLWTKKLDDSYAPAPDDKEGQERYQTIMTNKKMQGGNNHGVSQKKGALKHASHNIDVKTYKAMLAHPFNAKKLRVIWDENRKKDIIDKLTKKLSNDVAENRFFNEYFDATQGAFIQTKLDGIRCIAYLTDEGYSVLLSRTGKQLVHLLHVRDAIGKLLKNTPDIVLDGELYVHHPLVNGEKLLDIDRFRFISSACRTAMTKPNLNENLIQYHVFDIIDMGKDQTSRLGILKDLFSKYNGKDIVPVELRVAHNENDMIKYHEKFFNNDYEGVILRSPTGTYKGKRVLHLLKYKEFDDSEFLIVAASSAKGTEEGAVLWICETENGTRFSCRMRGTFENRKIMYDNYTDYLGCMLTVRYQGLGKDGVPRFPVGVVIRDYE